MASSGISLDRYVAWPIRTVKGYLPRLDSQIIQALLTYQSENNIAGHLCEIGVHHGQLFFMLALARRPGERSLAIDLFEDDSYNLNTPHAGRSRALFENARRLGIKLSDEETFKTSSLDIDAAAILARTTGPVRFFSVDGGHEYRHVENDLVLAERTLTNDGVVAVDDFFNPYWPEVTFAAYDFLRKTPTFVPVAMTSTKMYLTPQAVAKKYAAALAQRRDLARISRIQILGNDILVMSQGRAKKGFELLFGAIARWIS